MPKLDLINETKAWKLEGAFGREASFPRGKAELSPSLHSPPLKHLQFRRLRCAFFGNRSEAASNRGTCVDAIVDTGCPITIIPKQIWSGTFKYQEGKHFEVCSIAELGDTIKSQLLASSLQCRVVRLKVPVLLAGRSYQHESLVTINNLVAKLSFSDEPKEVLLGLWGGVLEGRRLVFDRLPEDDLSAHFEW